MEAEIFFSYAHKDRRYLERLKKHLIPLQREGLIKIWYDRKISPGKEWEEEIDVHLNSAQIILLFISPDFIASEYCYGKEMNRAIERHNEGKALVIPVILRPASWQTTPFGKFQALPPEAKPINDPYWVTQDSACLKVAEGIREAIQELFQKQPIAQPILLADTGKVVFLSKESEQIDGGNKVEGLEQSLLSPAQTDQLAKKPELSNILSNYRERLARIEVEIDLGGPYTLTEYFTRELDHLLVDIISTIRTIPKDIPYQVLREYFVSKENVLKSIRQAKIQVTVAIESLPSALMRSILNQGRPEAFYQHLNTCREHLEEALNNW